MLWHCQALGQQSLQNRYNFISSGVEDTRFSDMEDGSKYNHGLKKRRQKETLRGTDHISVVCPSNDVVLLPVGTDLLAMAK